MPDFDASPPPVAVFCYDRPVHLRLTLDALARSADFARYPVVIYQDGPGQRVDAAGHREVARVLFDLAHQHANVRLVERQKNLHFGNITEGVSELCEGYGRVIVIEDDVVVSPDFLRYAHEALDRYADDDRVGAVSGFVYDVDLPPDPQVFFLRQVLVWGWATWQRAWRHYDRSATGWQTIVDDPQQRDAFDLGGLRFSKMLRHAAQGRLNTWDVQWMATLFLRGQLSVFPRRSMTWNTGVASGVHGLGSHDVTDHRIDFIHGNTHRDDFEKPRLQWPIDWPQGDDVVTNTPIKAALDTRLRGAWSWPNRARRLLSQLLRRGGGLK